MKLRVLKIALVIALVLLLVPIPSWSQWKETIPPPDSPYWWTLTDDVTPQELRRVYLDDSFQQQQYRKSQELGLAPSLSKEQQDNIALFILGALTPEYHPFAEALWRFVGQIDLERQLGQTEQIQALSEFGVSETGINRLMTLVEETVEAEKALVEELDHDQSAFTAILTKLREEVPLEKYQEILRKRHYSRMAHIVGEDARTVREYAEAWDRDPVIETYAAATQILKSELSEEDWQKLRRYLLERIASRMNNVAFYSDTVRGWVEE